MAHLNDSWRRKPISLSPARSSTTEMPYLDQDDKMERLIVPPKLPGRQGQNQKSNFLADSPERQRAGKTRRASSLHSGVRVGSSNKAVSMSRYGNPPKPLPFIDPSSGEIDSRALHMWLTAGEIPKRSTSSRKPQEAIGLQSTRKEFPAQTLRAYFTRPPPSSGANAVPLGPKRRNGTRVVSEAE